MLSRSVVLSVSVLSLSVAAFACSSGSQQSPNGAASSSSSDGGTKKPVKIGNATGGGGGTAKPTKDAGSDVMPDPTPNTVPTCKGAALCVNDCADNDNACFEACMKGMPDDEFAKFEAVGTCVNNSGCADDTCIQETCGAEIQACLGE